MVTVLVRTAGGRRFDDARLARPADHGVRRPVDASGDRRPLDRRLQRLREVPCRHRHGRSARVARALARGRMGLRAHHGSGDDRARPARAAGHAERARGRGDPRLRPSRVAPAVSRLSGERRGGGDRVGALLRRLPHRSTATAARTAPTCRMRASRTASHRMWQRSARGSRIPKPSTRWPTCRRLASASRRHSWTRSRAIWRRGSNAEC